MKPSKHHWKHYADAKISRRTFLTGGALVGASAVAIAVAPNVAAASEQQIDDKTKQNKKDEGYRLTQHIADYYKSAEL